MWQPQIYAPLLLRLGYQMALDPCQHPRLVGAFAGIGVLGIWCFSVLTGPHDLTLLFLYSASGLGFGMRISLLTAIPADLFAGRHFGAILGFANGGGGLGGFIGPFLAGHLFDSTGDYPMSAPRRSWRSGGECPSRLARFMPSLARLSVW